MAGSVWNQARAARRDQAKYDPTNLFRMNQNIAPAPLADAPGDDRSTGRAGRSLRSTAQVWRHRSFAVRENRPPLRHDPARLGVTQADRAVADRARTRHSPKSTPDVQTPAPH
ncbi:BBE domain-containing protein [Paraburkholderia hospita]|uniref:BBE domain-containing protein n=1 Tax=Paraburkholderia hospita TaxID=169430 RepID=UPI003BF9C282